MAEQSEQGSAGGLEFLPDGPTIARADPWPLPLSRTVSPAETSAPAASAHFDPALAEGSLSSQPRLSVGEWGEVQHRWLMRRWGWQIAASAILVACLIWMPLSGIDPGLDPLTAIVYTVDLAFFLTGLGLIAGRRRFSILGLALASVAVLPYLFAWAIGGWLVVLVGGLIIAATCWFGQSMRRLRRYNTWRASAARWVGVLTAQGEGSKTVWVPPGPGDMVAPIGYHRLSQNRWIPVSIPADTQPSSWLVIQDGQVVASASEDDRLGYEKLDELVARYVASTTPSPPKGSGTAAKPVRGEVPDPD